MPAATLLSIDAAIEGATGLALIAVPGTVAWLLFGTAVPPIGAVVARVAGIAILSLALGCWLGREGNAVAALAALLVYNVLSAAYLAILVIQGELIGALLWPAVAVHGVFALLMAAALQPRPTRPGVKR